MSLGIHTFPTTWACHRLSDFSGAMGGQMFWLGPVPLLVLASAILLHFVVRRRVWQNSILLLLGGYVMWHESPMSFFLLFTSAAIEFLLATWILRSRSPRIRSALLWSSVAMNASIALLVLSRTLQSHFVAELHHAGILGVAGRELVVEFPKAYFVYVLVSKITLTLDAYKGRMKEPPRFLDAMAFSTLFTRFRGMPNDRARDTIPMLSHARRWNWVQAEDSLWLVASGLLKLGLLLELVGPTDRLLGRESSGLAVLVGAWIYAIRMYLDMSSLIDLFRGFALLVGIGLPENFDAPFLSRNISEFWRRWNITVMNFLNEEVFSRLSFALRGWGMWGVAFALLVTFMGSGLAHVLSWTMVIWSSIQAGSIVTYLNCRNRIRKWAKVRGNPGWMPVASWFLTMNVVALSMAMLSYNSVRATISVLIAMIHGPFWPAWCSSIGWGGVLAACAFTVLLQLVPHFRGGDTWMRKLRPWNRLAVGIGFVLLIILFN